MINEKELKEAFDYFNDELEYFKKHGATKQQINNQKILLDLASQVLKVEGITPENIHQWYLDATKELNPKSYNPNAQKKYEDLTEEQKFIDKYIVDQCKLIVARDYVLKSKLLDKDEIENTIREEIKKLQTRDGYYIVNPNKNETSGQFTDILINRQVKKMEEKV